MAKAFICIFSFRFPSQSCFTYVSPKVNLFATLLEFGNAPKIMNCIAKGHNELRDWLASKASEDEKRFTLVNLVQRIF